MAEHPNAALWRRMEDAFSRGDMDAVRNFWADDVVYHFSGTSVLAGDHRGKDGALAFFAKVGELTGGTLRVVELHDALASDDHVVGLLRVTASRGGRQISWNQAAIYNMRDGKITEAWLVPTDQRTLDEFLS